MIFCQGDKEDCMYFIRDGAASVYSTLEDGRERNLLISWPEHFSGLATFFEHDGREPEHMSSAIALTDCTVIIIHRDAFNACCREHPEIWHLIAAELSREIGLLMQQTVDSSLLTAEEKVARFFVRRYAENRCEVTESGIEMDYTQDFIARVLNLSRWAVNNVIRSMKERGWIKTSYRKIIILNMDALLNYNV